MASELVFFPEKLESLVALVGKIYQLVPFVHTQQGWWQEGG